MSEIDGVNEIAFIARSANRVRILKQLHQDGPLRKHDILERLNASRTTLGRNLDHLVERGWVSNTNGKYSVTPTGELVLSDFLELIDTVNSAKRLQPFLESQPIDELGLDVQALKGAQITESTRPDPYAPVRRHIETISSAERVRALLPTVGAEALESVKKPLQNGDAHHEMVVTPDVAETFRTRDEYSESIQPLIEIGCVDIHVSERRIPCYIGIVDGSIQIGASNENGIPHVLLETDSKETREWAERLFQEFRAEARPFVMNRDGL